MPVLHLKAKPNARRNQLEVAPDGSVVVRLNAPAQDGKANACLLTYLAEVFNVAKASLTLLSGHTAPFKKVEIAGISPEEMQAALARHRAV
ncbi:DUF167 domain-containing protein [Hymenobacter sp. HSC-4F20]|uniref:DUF167 domain-containing protein n=1 Tax=Hymenobacter sp. HSC-4F20 TaxID=2864135 RepID=UPI001C7345FF|nr:DUF167 domain-containing protein [Hymenobacter sp. HSC-4F20]MBX0292229.1 DUF167 domain-containing protein [Hymenobacter sp. HSC-4F20]